MMITDKRMNKKPAETNLIDFSLFPFNCSVSSSVSFRFVFCRCASAHFRFRSTIDFCCVYPHAIFVDSAFMSSPLEWCIQKCNQYVVYFFFGKITTRQRKDIGIVVSSCIKSNFGNPAQGGSYSLMFVDGHVDAVAGSANGYTGIAFSVFYGRSQRMCIIGIIGTLRRVSAKIFVGIPFSSRTFITYCLAW